MKHFKAIVFFIVIVVTALLLMSCDKSFNKFVMKFCSNTKIEKDIQSKPNIDGRNVALLGVIQGVTEFLPVSSTGHMILVEHFFDKKNPECASLCQDAMNAYFAIIQSGSIFAILIMYWGRIREMFKACLLKSEQGGYLIRNLLLSFLPAGAMGFFLNGILQNLLYNPTCIACALLFGAFLMMYTEVWYKKKTAQLSEIQHQADDQLRPIRSDEITSLSVLSCIKIGLWQCLALIPGMSRSMSTIVGGCFCNMSKKSAAEYSFLLGFVTLSAATMFKLLKDHSVLFEYFSMWTFLEGILVAFVCSLLTIRLFIAYLGSHGLWLFAWYRIILGVAILFWLK